MDLEINFYYMILLKDKFNYVNITILKKRILINKEVLNECFQTCIQFIKFIHWWGLTHIYIYIYVYIYTYVYISIYIYIYIVLCFSRTSMSVG